MPLTDTKCRNAKGQIKPRKLSDGGGLHLLITPDGAKYWRLAYRWHGKQRTLAIGVYPAIGLMEARAARDEAKRNLAADIDPSLVKQERKRAARIATDNTFEAIAREWHENWKGARSPYYAAQRHRAMPLSELPTFLRKLECYSGEQQTKLALKLVTLTFLRTTELRAGKWSELENLDENSAVWRIPAERMKMRLEHLVPLSRQAVAVLRELRALSGGSPNIFPSPGKSGCMSSNTILYAIYRMGYHGRATTHGFRAVASTILNETNLFNRDWIERQLSHVERNEVRRAYNAAEWMPDRRRMMQWWADHITALALEGDKIVPLSRAG